MLMQGNALMIYVRQTNTKEKVIRNQRITYIDLQIPVFTQETYNTVLHGNCLHLQT